MFIKNVPFSASNDDLKTCMEQFGKVIYALICTDPVTEHSKGTAFVKFQVCYSSVLSSVKVCYSGWFITQVIWDIVHYLKYSSVSLIRNLKVVWVPRMLWEVLLQWCAGPSAHRTLTVAPLLALAWCQPAVK